MRWLDMLAGSTLVVTTVVVAGRVWSVAAGSAAPELPSHVGIAWLLASVVGGFRLMLR